ncbi:hypothetical protein DE146DRAFT_621768 [Phaeosphaeria sp. MPI-PUGE-AT-0046c]|nr:hypothetical protein DE146DRAFT_621768 [Phaeosphaeria sp. MPI-PUGE-AT-0046c]
MAPYALTPTSEQDDPFRAEESTLQHFGSSLNGHSTLTGSEANEPHTEDPATFQSNGHHERTEILPSSGTGDQGCSIGAGDVAPAASYEDAYTDGYKDGYTLGYKTSHIKLQHQPIAIIGMSCRLPGSVSTPDEFWELLARSRTGFSPIPATRFSENRFFHPNPGKSGTTNARGGNFLTHDLTAFDAPFFGFTQQEAISLDPQQRLLLECTFEALEAAGIPKHDVVGKDVGVFVGGTFSEYDTDLFRDPETMPMHQATGCAMAMQSNRISHFFDFRGPSFTVDTACSSSLVALHTACNSLRNGESSMAVAAGVHLNMLPEFWISYSMSRLFGESGRSFAFDQRGTGYGRGEGCGLVLLKTLEDAVKDNDPIRAVIVGTGINQDGKTPGITMPNGAAQEALIRSVYKNGGMDPCDTGYVEAHGTGTRVGDPIEVGALQKVFGEGRSKRKPLYIGSVKSNIGHLEAAAAGIAGVIKTAMMLERNFVLPNYDFKHPNESIPFDQWNLKVPIRQQPWPLGKRWASVNGFGFGGTNGHIVLTKAPLERKVMKEEIDTQIFERLFVLSANDKISLENAMQNLGVYLEQRPEVFQNNLLSNLAYTLGQRRSFHPWRIAVSASSSVELVEALSGGRVLPCKQELEALRLGWVFTGQGAQWWAMGRELYQQHPVYTSAMDRADSHLRSIGAEFSLVTELGKEEDTTAVNAATISQPSCTAVQLALVDLLRSWGVQPSAVVGHSSGEIGAAYAANFITFEDAMTIAYHRGRLIPILKKKHPSLEGCMMAVGAGEMQITPLLDQIPISFGQARIACINSPSSVTISGDTAAVTQLQAIIEGSYPGMFVRKLQIDTAYHSHHMSLVAKEYTQALCNIQAPKLTGDVRFHSSLLGRLVAGYELDVTYWVQNLTCTVRFDEAVQSMCLPQNKSDFKTGVNCIVELGPHAALQGPIKQILKHMGGPISKIAYTSMLSRKRDAVQTALAVAGALFVKGATLDMGALNFPQPLERPPQVLVDMPRYSWNHSGRFYHESRFTQIHKFHDALRNDVIGVLAPYSNDFEKTWRNVVRLDDLPWLRHHQLQGVTLFPISGFLVMAIEAAAQISQLDNTQHASIEINDLIVKTPVALTEEELEMTITLRPCHHSTDIARSHEFIIRSWSKNKGWAEHCTGETVVFSKEVNEVDGERTKQARQGKLNAICAAAVSTANQPVRTEDLYEQLSKITVVYGPSFQGLKSCHASCRSARAQLVVPDTVGEMPHHTETNYVLHPALIEQLISMYWPMFSVNGALDTVHVPTSIRKFTVSLAARDNLEAPGRTLDATSVAPRLLSEFRANTLSMFALNEAAEAVITIEDLSISPIIERNLESEDDGPHELCYQQTWEALPGQHENDYKKSTFVAEVVIVHGETELQSRMASALAGQLVEITGSQPTMGTLATICGQSEDKLCIFLTEIDCRVLANLTELQFVNLQRLLTSVRGLLWIVHGAYGHAKNPTSNMVSGLSRTLRSEGTLMKFITLELDGKSDIDVASMVRQVTSVFSMTLCADSEIEETEFLERDGKLLTPRIIHDHDLNDYVDKQVNPPATASADFTDTTRPLRAMIAFPGVLDSLTFEDDESTKCTLPDDHVEFQIKAIGINAADNGERSFVGLECSGIVTAIGSCVPNICVGDRIAAITTTGSLSTIARTDFRYVMILPNYISFEAAAAMPLAYCTASHALIDRTAICEHESMLVHDAASAVGQAAISIADMAGVEIWATVRTKDQRDFLRQEFGISEDKIWYAGDDSFAEHILDGTQGRGVDVIFNTLPDANLLQATSKCLAKFGTLVNLQQVCGPLDKDFAKKNADVIFADTEALVKHRPQLIRETLGVVARMLQFGRLRPILHVHNYSISEAVSALNNVQAAGIHGKAVITPKLGDLVQAPTVEQKSDLLGHDATYVLIGGTGGLGRSMAKWMVENGAKHIVLLSRSGTVKGQGKEQIARLNEGGANVVVRSCDVTNRVDVQRLISTGLVDMPPVRGIIHGAMVLHDVLFEKMKYEQYTSVIASKVQGAWNFYHALPISQLDFFIVISSAAGAVGNRGQAAYAAANTFLNGFAQHLRSQGIKSAASIDLTAVSDAGYLAEDADKAAEVARNLGSDTICEAQVLALIRAAIDGKLESCNGHPITGMRITPTVQPFWTGDAKFLHLRRAAEAASATSTTATISWSAAFKAATSHADAEQVVCNALVEKIAHVVSMEPEELDVTRSISHYPLDSLTAIEVRNFITRMFEANLQVLELLASGSIESLSKVVCTKSKVAVAEG